MTIEWSESMAKKLADEIVTEEVTNSEEKACKKNGKKVLIAVIAFVAVAILCVGGFFLYRMLKTNDPVNVTSDDKLWPFMVLVSRTNLVPPVESLEQSTYTSL